MTHLELIAFVLLKVSGKRDVAPLFSSILLSLTSFVAFLIFFNDKRLDKVSSMLML